VNNAAIMVLLPLIILAAGIVLLLLVIAFKRNHLLSFILSALILAGGFCSLFFIMDFVPQVIAPLVIVDYYALFYIGLIMTASLAIVFLSYDYLRQQVKEQEEYYLLLLMAALGSGVLVISQHFIALFLGLEILSVSLYVLISYLYQREQNIEAGVKYLVLAASSSAFLLFGMALIYNATGTMEFIQLAQRLAMPASGTVLVFAGIALMLVGIGFKLAVVPFHMWTPDVYQGAPAPVTTFIATISKGGMFALILRFFITFDIYRFKILLLIFTIIAITSMFTGNLLALRQQNVKRILAYSSIAHLGYLLVAFLAGSKYAVPVATFYLVAYFVTTIGAFGIISILSSEKRDADDIEDYRGLYWRHPWLAAIFTAALFSLAGIPLTAGFVGKFYVLIAGVNSSLWLLMVILVVNSAIGLYYYLRIVVAMFTPIEHGEKVSAVLNPKLSLLSGMVLGIMLLLLIWLGVYPFQLIDLIQSVGSSLDYKVIESINLVP
jgi:NADH-quinone oxidoreductase subunit N